MTRAVSASAPYGQRRPDPYDYPVTSPVVIRLVADDDDLEPDMWLVAKQDVSAADLIAAAGRCGWLSDDGDRWFSPAVAAR